MKRRKPNIYFDRKSFGLKLGKKPLSTAEKKRQHAIEKQDREHAKIAARAERKQARQAAGKQFRQLRSEAKKEARARELAKDDQELWQELYGRSNPARVFPGSLTDSERAALRKLVRRTTMSKKKKSRKRKNGKMPAGLAAYWRKKRAKKAKRKNPKKRPRAKVRRPRRRKTVRRRIARRAPPKMRRRARRKPNARRRVKIVKAPRGMTGKRLRAFAREMGAKYGAPARVIGR